jgi:hypothetical protein
MDNRIFVCKFNAEMILLVHSCVEWKQSEKLDEAAIQVIR